MPPHHTKPTDKFWKDFSDALSKQGEVRPRGKGWESLDEIVRAAARNRTNVNSKLMEGVKAGILERFQGMAYKNGLLRRASWYRHKPAK